MIVRFFLWITGYDKEVKKAEKMLEDELARLRKEKEEAKAAAHKKYKSNFVFDIDDRTENPKVSEEFMGRSNEVYYAPDIKSIDKFVKTTSDIIPELKNISKHLKGVKNWDEYVKLISDNKAKVISPYLDTKLGVFDSYTSASRVVECKTAEEAAKLIENYKASLKTSGKNLPEIQSQLKNIQSLLDKLGFSDATDDIMLVETDLQHAKHELLKLVNNIKLVSTNYNKFISGLHKAINVCVDRNSKARAKVGSGGESADILFSIDQTYDIMDKFDDILENIKSYDINTNFNIFKI